MKAITRERPPRSATTSIPVVVLAALGVWALPGAVPEARAQDARALTLEESVRLGLEHNVTLRATVADAVAADAARRQVRADQLPALRSQASYTRLSDNIPGVEFTLPGTDSTVTFQAVELDRFQSEVSVEMPLLTQLRLRHATRAATHEAAAAELTVDQERSDVAYRIRRAYWELYRAEAVRGRIDAAAAQVDAHLADVRARLEEGAVLPRDVLAAQTRRSEVRLERVEAENAVQVARLELNRLIGLPLDTPVRTASDAAVEGPERATGVPSAEAVAERPQIEALAERVRGYREQVLAAEAARIPDLDFIGRYVYSRPNPYFFQEQGEFRGTWELMFSARWGIWEGGRRAARTGEARAQLEAAEARLAATREQVAVDIARLRLEVERAQEATEVAAQNVAEAEESYRVVRQQFAEGAALSADVLDAEEALRRARAREVEARTDHAIARAAVLNALGRVW
jgi:outer membrane protein